MLNVFFQFWSLFEEVDRSLCSLAKGFSATILHTHTYARTHTDTHTQGPVD